MLRNNGCLLVSLLAMTLSSGMPELQSEADLEYMREMLQLNDNITEEAALTHFRSHTRINNVIMLTKLDAGRTLIRPCSNPTP